MAPAVTRSVLFCGLLLLASLAVAEDDKFCQELLMDSRQSEIHPQVSRRVELIRGLPTRARAGVPAHKNLYEGINLPIDEIDKQIWAMSQMNGNVEVAIYEVVGKSGLPLALSRFYVGDLKSVQMNSEDLFSIIDRLRAENKIKFSEIAYVGWRHNHPPGLMNGIFSPSDMGSSFTLQTQLEERYGIRIPIQMTVLWKSVVGRLVNLITSPSQNISKMSARISHLNGEVVEGPYVFSSNRHIPIAGYPEADPSQ